jgi:hypothetical protein
MKQPGEIVTTANLPQLAAHRSSRTGSTSARSRAGKWAAG